MICRETLGLLVITLSCDHQYQKLFTGTQRFE